MTRWNMLFDEVMENYMLVAGEAGRGCDSVLRHAQHIALHTTQV